MRILLELLRIIFLFVILGGICMYIIGSIYTVNEGTETYTWLGQVAVLILFFVLYRNKLQFSGWYKGKGRVKLPRRVSLTLICGSIVLMILPLLLGAFIS